MTRAIRFMLLTMALTCLLSRGAGATSVQVGSAYALPGDSNIAVPIIVATSVDLAGMEFLIEYDSEQLTADSIMIENQASALDGSGYNEFKKGLVAALVYASNGAPFMADSAIVFEFLFSVADQAPAGTLLVAITEVAVVDIQLQYDSTQVTQGGVIVCVCACHTDPNCDGAVTDALDIAVTIDVIFFGLPAITDPDCFYERTDVNCDAYSDAVDLAMIIDVTFFGEDPATFFCVPCSQ